VIVETPLQTGWPAMAALLLLLVGLWLGGHALRPVRRQGLPLLAVAVLALVVRLFVIPAWSRHAFDGHEAEYWDIFRGVRALSRGGPVLYPSMQWFWATLGAVLPADPHVPVLVSALFGVGSVVALGVAVALLADGPAGVLAALVLALHPVHAAWSSSAYHVVHPYFFATLSLLAVAALLQRGAEGSARERVGLSMVLAASLALAVATRIEAGLYALPCVLLLFLSRAEGALPWRQRLLALPALVTGGVLALLAARPILFPGQLPGTGDHAVAFAGNVGILAYHAPFDTLPALLLVAAGALLALRRWPLPTVLLAVFAVGNHLLMATFDDYGDRHTLPAAWAIAWAIGAGSRAVPGQARRLGVALALGGLAVTASGLSPLRTTYYGPEERFLALLDSPPYDELPRHPLERVATVVAPPGRCGWVAEDFRVARDPPRSHFNVLDPVEADGLRGPDGCLRWCADVQDWRWSSRGVRDRATRLHHLYETMPVGVVEDADSGFACVVWQLGRRVH